MAERGGICAREGEAGKGMLRQGAMKGMRIARDSDEGAAHRGTESTPVCVYDENTTHQ